jgi:hypothetical protein
MAHNRLDLLKGGVGVAAGAIGAGAGLAPAANARASTKDAGAALLLTLAGNSVRARVHGQSRGRLPKLDDHVTIHGQVTDERGAEGMFGATAVAVRFPGRDEITLLEHHLFSLPDGTLTGSGQRIDGTGTFAITGGTGRFAGARGSYFAELSPSGLGGDGTAHFEFTLTIQER